MNFRSQENEIQQFEKIIFKTNHKQKILMVLKEIQKKHVKPNLQIQMCCEKGVRLFSKDKYSNFIIFQKFSFLLQAKFILNFISQYKVLTEQKIYFFNLKVENTFFSFQSRKFKHFGLQNSFLLKEFNKETLLKRIVQIQGVSQQIQTQEYGSLILQVIFNHFCKEYFSQTEWNLYKDCVKQKIKRTQNINFQEKMLQFSYFQFSYALLKLFSNQIEESFLKTIVNVINQQKQLQNYKQNFEVDQILDPQLSNYFILILLKILRNFFSCKDHTLCENDLLILNLKEKLISRVKQQSNKLSNRINNIFHDANSFDYHQKQNSSQQLQIQPNQTKQNTNQNTSTTSKNSQLNCKIEMLKYQNSTLNKTQIYLQQQYEELLKTFLEQQTQFQWKDHISIDNLSSKNIYFQKDQFINEGAEIDSQQNKSVKSITNSYVNSQLSLQLILQKQVAQISKDLTYGKYVKKRRHYHKYFVGIDFYIQGLKYINIPILRNNRLNQLSYLSLGGIPIKAKGLRQLLKIPRFFLIALSVYCCQIQTAVGSNLQNQPNLEFLSISFNQFGIDSLEYFRRNIFPKIQVLKISFQSFQMWKQFSNFIHLSFPCITQLYIRNDDPDIFKKFQQNKIFQNFDDLNYRYKRPQDISQGCEIIYDEDQSQVINQNSRC